MKDLKELRERLDKLDNSLVLTLAERMRLIPKIAEFKKANNIAQFQPEREKQIFEAKKKLALELSVNPELVEAIFKEIIKEAHRIEKPIIDGGK